MVELYINGKWVTRPLDNVNVRKNIERMLEGNYNFRCDELPTVMSNEEVRLSISFIDAIQFTIVNPKSNTSVSNKPQREKKKRSRNPSGFFPYRLKQE